MRSRAAVLQLENERSHQSRPLTKLQAPPPLPPTIAPHNPLHNLPHQQIKASPYCLLSLQQIYWFILLFGWLILAEKSVIYGLVRRRKRREKEERRKREGREGREKRNAAGGVLTAARWRGSRYRGTVARFVAGGARLLAACRPADRVVGPATWNRATRKR